MYTEEPPSEAPEMVLLPQSACSLQQGLWCWPEESRLSTRSRGALRFSCHRRHEWLGGSRARPYGGTYFCRRLSYLSLPHRPQSPKPCWKQSRRSNFPSGRKANRPRVTQLQSVGWCDPWSGGSPCSLWAQIPPDSRHGAMEACNHTGPTLPLVCVILVSTHKPTLKWARQQLCLRRQQWQSRQAPSKFRGCKTKDTKQAHSGGWVRWSKHRLTLFYFSIYHTRWSLNFTLLLLISLQHSLMTSVLPHHLKNMIFIFPVSPRWGLQRKLSRSWSQVPRKACTTRRRLSACSHTDRAREGGGLTHAVTGSLPTGKRRHPRLTFPPQDD